MTEFFNGKTEEDKKKIHLFLTNKCTHNCEFCCNKEYSIEEIPVILVSELKLAEDIFLTGGEPFLLEEINSFAYQLKKQYKNIKNITVYSCGDSFLSYLQSGRKIDNIDMLTLSPKNEKDVKCVKELFSNDLFLLEISKLKSIWLYIFPEVKELLRDFKIKKELNNVQLIDREWQENFTPNSGIFRRLPILF